MSMHMHGTPLHSRSQASDSLHVEASESLRAAVEALLCTWKRTGEMQKADPSDADCPAWDVAAIRKMVLSDVQCRQIWQRGDPGGRLKINDTFSQIVRASVNKVFGVEQVLAKAIGLRNPRLGHLQSRISSEARVWADLNVSEELRACGHAAQQRAAVPQPQQVGTKRVARSGEQTKTRWLESEDSHVVAGGHPSHASMPQSMTTRGRRIGDSSGGACAPTPSVHPRRTTRVSASTGSCSAHSRCERR